MSNLTIKDLLSRLQPNELLALSEEALKESKSRVYDAENLVSHSLVIRSSEGDFTLPEFFTIDLMATFRNTQTT